MNVDGLKKVQSAALDLMHLLKLQEILQAPAGKYTADEVREAAEEVMRIAEQQKK